MNHHVHCHGCSLSTWKTTALNLPYTLPSSTSDSRTFLFCLLYLISRPIFPKKESIFIWPYSIHSISSAILDIHISDLLYRGLLRGSYLPWRRRSSLGKKVKTTSDKQHKMIEKRKDFFFFLWPHLQHMEVPGPGVESELQLPAYTTAMATPDPNCICNLCHSLQQILDP